ncbi:MAG: hypothetical protein BGO57_00590 [Sphingomonadales bacterium 63-6]|nr:MAG: hypothetical protein BGO57_00590 [Sphingomonadales bacterium 63-6]
MRRSNTRERCAHSQPHRRYSIALIGAAVLLASCSPLQQDTPEPGDAEKIKALVQKLGLTPSWTAKLKAKVMGGTPERGDGIILFEWLARRKATLEGKLDVYKLPALKNPGTVEDMLAWERAAQLKDEKTRASYEGYLTLTEAMGRDCPMVITQEEEWLGQYRTAHATGKQKDMVNWDLRGLQLQQPCQAEMDQAASLSSYIPDTRPFTPAEQQLINRFADAHANCRGSEDEEERRRGCEEEGLALTAMNEAKLCWGRLGQVEAEFIAHRCTPSSIGYQP